MNQHNNDVETKKKNEEKDQVVEMSFSRFWKSNRKSLSIYVRFLICILLIYFLNLIFGFRSYRWGEKSFDSEYHLTMKQLDAVKIDLNAEKHYGQPINYLSSQFRIRNEFLCGRSSDRETKSFPHLLILVKSFVQHRKQRETIRLTWANKYFLEPKNIRLAFVVGASLVSSFSSSFHFSFSSGKDFQNRSIEDESTKYGDLIQIDQIDYYYYSSC